MNPYFTVKGGEYEYVVSKSRFIGICRRVANDGEAAQVLNEIRRKYRDATHVCHAYVTRESSRSSDDGEPSGTAGVPILESINSANLSDTLVAVVRYFGGIKLGTGGLGRAYSFTAAHALEAAGRSEVCDCDVYKVSLEYPVYKKTEKRQPQSLYKLLKTEYNNTVDLYCATCDGEAYLCEMTSLTQGRFTHEYLGRQTTERDAD